jgi:hypothetical protein
MLVITLWASQIFLQEDWPPLWFGLVCIGTGVGYYFMPTIALFPVFLTPMLWLLKRIRLSMAVTFLLIAFTIVGLMVWPHQSYVRAHRNDPGITPPVFWYNLWLGNQASRFYSTEEERFQEYFRDRTQATGKSSEDISKEEFLASVSAHPIPYALHTVKKLLHGNLSRSMGTQGRHISEELSHFKTQNPRKVFRHTPERILCESLVWASARSRRPSSFNRPCRPFPAQARAQNRVGLFFTVPVHFLLILMFFHYEARYLTGTLGYSLAGYALSRSGAGPRRSLPSTIGLLQIIHHRTGYCVIGNHTSAVIQTIATRPRSP